MIRCRLFGHDPTHIGERYAGRRYACRRCRVTEPGCWDAGLTERAGAALSYIWLTLRAHAATWRSRWRK